MKSIFLLTMILSSLTTAQVWGQSKTKKVVKPAAPAPQTTEVAPAAPTVEKSSFDKFYDRLKIGYFGVFTSPHFDDIDKGKYNNAAISPEWGNAAKGKQKNQDTWPTNFWNQIAFRYNFGAKMDFVFNPRFMIPLSKPKDMTPPEDRSFFMLDDFLLGFQGVVMASADKKFNFWMRPGVRIPTSHASRNSGNAGFGQLSHQLELAINPTYDFNPKWQVAWWGQFRQWVYENRYNWSRFRIIASPYVQYSINDKFRWLTYYQTIIENNKRWKSVNGKKPVFKDYDQEVYTGPSIDVTPKLNIFPYISAFVDDIPITDKSFYIGAWISYQIK